MTTDIPSGLIIFCHMIWFKMNIHLWKILLTFEKNIIGLWTYLLTMFVRKAITSFAGIWLVVRPYTTTNQSSEDDHMQHWWDFNNLNNLNKQLYLYLKIYNILFIVIKLYQYTLCRCAEILFAYAMPAWGVCGSDNTVGQDCLSSIQIIKIWFRNR